MSVCLPAAEGWGSLAPLVPTGPSRAVGIFRDGIRVEDERGPYELRDLAKSLPFILRAWGSAGHGFGVQIRWDQQALVTKLPSGPCLSW